jgi:DNA mismatch endonuclease (patch repair protein)
MTDCYNRDTRSRVMSRIRSSGNRSTEKRFRALLVSSGLSGWKLHPRAIEGKPDFYFVEPRVAVFIDGCFWHGCPKCYIAPISNSAYWSSKILRNRSRRMMITKKLESQGIKVVQLWEHDLRRNPRTCVNKVVASF